MFFVATELDADHTDEQIDEDRFHARNEGFSCIQVVVLELPKLILRAQVHTGEGGGGANIYIFKIVYENDLKCIQNRRTCQTRFTMQILMINLINLREAHKLI